MHSTLKLSFVLGLAATVHAQGTLQVSIGVRETGAGGGAPFTAIGADGGATGGIEWINRDNQTIILDGVWRQYTFTFASDPVLGFAGATANGTLDGTYGTLEHIRILNNTGITAPITLWIDDITHTDTNGSTTFGSFEGYGSGTEVMFQEPNFSGSTSANILTGSTGGVDNMVASRTASDRFSFQFIDGTATRWVRLTTFNSLNQRNPQIRFDNGSTLTFWMRGGVAQENLGSQGPGSAYCEGVGTGLQNGEITTFYAAGAPANTLGIFALSYHGFPDLPIFGGTIVSGTGILLTTVVFTDANGRVALPLAGFGNASNAIDMVWQAGFIDNTLPESIAFTNALRARYGR